jgi:hypothetical protein
MHPEHPLGCINTCHHETPSTRPDRNLATRHLVAGTSRLPQAEGVPWLKQAHGYLMPTLAEGLDSGFSSYELEFDSCGPAAWRSFYQKAIKPIMGRYQLEHALGTW